MSFMNQPHSLVLYILYFLDTFSPLYSIHTVSCTTNVLILALEYMLFLYYCACVEHCSEAGWGHC